MTCTAPVGFDALVDYWSGDLEGGRAEQVEEHVFACAACAGELEVVARLAGGVRAWVTAGAMRGVVPGALVERLERDGLRIRTFRVEPGGSAPCSTAPGDELLVVRLALAAGASAPLDVDIEIEGGVEVPGWPQRFRLADVPVDTARRQVVVAVSPRLVRDAPSHRVRFRLLSAAGGEHSVGDYVLEHSPWDEARGA